MFNPRDTDLIHAINGNCQKFFIPSTKGGEREMASVLFNEGADQLQEDEDRGGREPVKVKFLRVTGSSSPREVLEILSRERGVSPEFFFLSKDQVVLFLVTHPFLFQERMSPRIYFLVSPPKKILECNINTLVIPAYTQANITEVDDSSIKFGALVIPVV